MTLLAPAQLAGLAEASLANQGSLTPSRWARVTAFLLRQSLERAIVQAWRQAGHDADRWNMRAQLLCLPTIADDATARRASYTWWTLTRACHHHPYELPPTHPELTDLLTTVRSLLRDLPGEQQPTHAGPRS